MDSIIQTNYGTRTYCGPAKAHEANQPGTVASSFLDMAAQTCRSRTDMLTIGADNIVGTKVEQTSQANSISEVADMDLETYKKSIREKISQMPLSATRQMESISIQISDKAFERLQNDPDYEAWVLNDLREALSQSNPWVPASGGGYSVFYIGATKEECHAEGWYPGYQGGQGAAKFEDKAKDSFWEQRMERHKRYIELQQEAATKRQMMKQRMNGDSVSVAELLMRLL